MLDWNALSGFSAFQIYMLGLRRTPENPRLQQLAYTCLEIFREGICENRCLQSKKAEDIFALNIFQELNMGAALYHMGELITYTLFTRVLNNED